MSLHTHTNKKFDNFTLSFMGLFVFTPNGCIDLGKKKLVTFYPRQDFFTPCLYFCMILL